MWNKVELVSFLSMVSSIRRCDFVRRTKIRGERDSEQLSFFGALGTQWGSHEKDLSVVVSPIGPMKYSQRGLCGWELMRTETRKTDTIDIINPVFQEDKTPREGLCTCNSFCHEHSPHLLTWLSPSPPGFCFKVTLSGKPSLTSMAKIETFFLSPSHLLAFPILAQFSLFLHSPHH